MWCHHGVMSTHFGCIVLLLSRLAGHLCLRDEVAAVAQDCVQKSREAVDSLRFEHPSNLVHWDRFAPEIKDAWRASPLLESDPEALFHTGEAVGSCQSITGEMVKESARACTSDGEYSG